MSSEYINVHAIRSSPNITLYHLENSHLKFYITEPGKPRKSVTIRITDSSLVGITRSINNYLDNNGLSSLIGISTFLVHQAIVESL